ncbi:hypothetical protein EVAR_42033_1 [Eumeta japonica]|uniref:Uncharacterized protein n=1 Tax=Eumeta variegata TaxID=151549 RepID=A0A4C1Y6P4_EUMVA|nr:hypothetical protein EVAR_42033_1 [Eumeta japonica]
MGEALRENGGKQASIRRSGRKRSFLLVKNKQRKTVEFMEVGTVQITRSGLSGRRRRLRLPVRILSVQDFVVLIHGSSSPRMRTCHVVHEKAQAAANISICHTAARIGERAVSIRNAGESEVVL